MKIFLKILLGLVILGASWIFLHSAVIVFDGLKDELGEAEVIVVLGNKVNEDGTLSKRLKSRLDKALELYNEGFSGRVIVSGGVGKEGHNEAKVMEEYLLENGVKWNDIVVDDDGYNTYMTAKNVRDMGYESVLVVTQYYHISRTELAFRMFGMEVFSASADIGVEFRDPYSIFREFVAFYSYLLKDYS